MEKKALKIFGLLIISIGIYGFACPALVSSTINGAVAFGTVLAVSWLWTLLLLTKDILFEKE